MRRTVYFIAPLLALALMLAPVASTQQQLPLPSALEGTNEPVPHPVDLAQQQLPLPTATGGASDSRPSPDPTRLTTEQLIRELNSLREILTARMDAAEKERTSILNRLEKFDAVLEKRVLSLQALNEERFASIALQFRERDTRTEQTSRDNKTAVEAAFQAAKEAVNTAFSSAKEAVAAQQASASLAIAKSEAGTSKQIDQLANLFETSMKGLSAKVDDLKQRQTATEGAGIGSKDYRENSQGNVLYVVGIIGGLVGLASLVYNLVKPKP